MPRRYKWSEIERILVAIASGLSRNQASKDFKVNRRSIWIWEKRYGLPTEKRVKEWGEENGNPALFKMKQRRPRQGDLIQPHGAVEVWFKKPTGAEGKLWPYWIREAKAKRRDKGGGE